jgi:hypothetical protein
MVQPRKNRHFNNLASIFRDCSVRDTAKSLMGAVFVVVINIVRNNLSNLSF